MAQTGTEQEGLAYEQVAPPGILDVLYWLHRIDFKPHNRSVPGGRRGVFHARYLRVVR
jgi:hypothetical protein